MPGGHDLQKKHIGAAGKKCDCELCSAGKPPIKLPVVKNVVSRSSRAALNAGLEDTVNAACQKRCPDIIRRNKRAVKILSKKVRESKMVMPPCIIDSRCSPTQKKKKEPAESPLDGLVLSKRRDCACELMARAIRADLHRHMALAERRAQINAGVFATPPPEREHHEEK